MSQITQVHALDNHQIEVALDNGSSVMLNLKPKLRTIRFGPLRDEAFFHRADTNGYVIRWENKVELSIGEIFEIIKR